MKIAMLNTSSDECSAMELHDRLSSHERIQLVDVRKRQDFDAGHIQGAMSIRLADLPSRAPDLYLAGPTVVISESGSDSLSAEQILRERGLVNVRRLLGGMMIWRQAGFPLEIAKKSSWSVDHQARFAGASLILTLLVLSFLWPILMSVALLLTVAVAGAAAFNRCLLVPLLARLPWNRSWAAITPRPSTVR